MTTAWKYAVSKELDRRDKDPSSVEWYGRSRIELARRIGADKSAITRMLDDQTSSAWVPSVSHELGVPMPVIGTNAEIAQIVAQLEEDPATLELALQFLRRLVKK